MTALLWDQHLCLPLQPDTEVAPLNRYQRTRGALVSVNAGCSPHSLNDTLAPSPVATGFVDVPVVTEDVVLSDRLHAEVVQNPLGGSVAGVDDGQYALGSVIQRPGQTGCRGFGGIAVTPIRACEVKAQLKVLSVGQELQSAMSWPHCVRVTAHLLTPWRWWWSISSATRWRVPA
jgi:hypothetical protein